MRTVFIILSFVLVNLVSCGYEGDQAIESSAKLKNPSEQLRQCLRMPPTQRKKNPTCVRLLRKN